MMPRRVDVWVLSTHVPASPLVFFGFLRTDGPYHIKDQGAECIQSEKLSVLLPVQSTLLHTEIRTDKRDYSDGSPKVSVIRKKHSSIIVLQQIETGITKAQSPQTSTPIAHRNFSNANKSPESSIIYSPSLPINTRSLLG